MQKEVPQKAPVEYLQHLFDQYASHYDTHLMTQLDYQVPELLYQTISREMNIETPQLKILDLGCGTGLSGKRFKPFAKELMGVDISEKMIAIAKQNNIYDTVEVNDISQALDHYKEIDLMLAGDVLTYMGELDALFQKITVALAPRGWFAFTVEKTTIEPYTLQQTLRYAHSKNYLLSLIEKYHFETVCFESVVLRKHRGKVVRGYLVVLTK